MGFATGFTGGVTLTLGLAYLSVLSHERNRQAQALYLRSQHQLLNSLLDPPPEKAPSREEFARQSRHEFTQTAKDRWNEEIENAVRRVQTTDWTGVREGLEGAVARLLGRGLQTSREGLEDAERKTGPKIQEAVDRSKAAGRKTAEHVASNVNSIAATTVAKAEQASGAVKSRLDKVATTTKEDIAIIEGKAQSAASSVKASTKKVTTDARSAVNNAATSTRSAVDHAIEKSHEKFEKHQVEDHNTGAGTVGAVRGALRNVVSKGIEKGKEVMEKAQEAVGLATEKVQSVETDVEKAMQQRYENFKEFEKSAEEVLEERLKPMDQRDTAVLRAV